MTASYFIPVENLESSIFSKGGRQIDFDLFKIHAISNLQLEKLKLEFGVNRRFS